jgi:5-methylcytosine-specific restriction endonuclease McrA
LRRRPEHRVVKIPHDGPKGQCRWCGGRITLGRWKTRRWHDGRAGERDCIGEYRTLTDPRRMKKALIHRDGHVCAACGSSRCVLEMDHVVPLIDGGAFELSNMQLLCGKGDCCSCGKNCHARKTARENAKRARVRRSKPKPRPGRRR